MPEAQALCARHPGTEATFTCTRCGSFGCAQCQARSSADLCQSVALDLPWLSEPASLLIALAMSLAIGIAMAVFDTLYTLFYLRLTRGKG
jgi:hypothetical protein